MDVNTKMDEWYIIMKVKDKCRVWGCVSMSYWMTYSGEPTGCLLGLNRIEFGLNSKREG